MSKHGDAAREIKAMILADPHRSWDHTWDVADIKEIIKKHFPDHPACPDCGTNWFASVSLPEVIICKGCGHHVRRLDCAL